MNVIFYNCHVVIMPSMAVDYKFSVCHNTKPNVSVWKVHFYKFASADFTQTSREKEGTNKILNLNVVGIQICFKIKVF